MSNQESHDYQSISTHMAKGAIWMVMMRWSLKAIGLINTIIIARLLTPDDFGIIAMAMIAFAFLETLSDVDADNILLRNKNAAREDYDSTWTIKVILGVGVTAAMFAAAPLCALYFDDERVTTVIQIISFRALILGFENVGVVDFRKDLKFSKEFRYWIYRRITLFVFSLTLVFTLRNYYALAIAIPLSAAITVAISFKMSSYRPKLCFKKFKEIWAFSVWLLVERYSDFFANRADEIIVGGISNTSTMGSYHVGSDLAMLPTREVVLPMTRALVPTYSKIAHDGEELRKAFCGVFNYVAILCASVSLGLFVVAEDLVIVLLGDQWYSAIPFFKWLALYGGLEGLIFPLTAFFIVLDKQKLLAFLGLVRISVLIPVLIAVSLWYDIETIAMSRTVVMALFVFVFYGVVFQISGVKISHILSATWRPVAAAALMSWGITYLHNPGYESHYASLAQDVSIGVITFPVALCALWFLSGRPDGAEKTTFTMGWEKFSDRFLKR
jgi:lipopolysaccharide exporter